MGTIRNDATKEQRMLAEWTVLGRSPRCDIRMGAAEVSSEHTAIRWTDGRWRAIDLDSRNGTWIDSRRIAPGESVELTIGTPLCLGSPRELWVLSSDAPPVAFARCEGRERAAEFGLLALPSPEEPLLEVARGSDGSWFVEDETGRQPALDRLVYTVGGESWRIYLPSDLPNTAVAGSAAIADAELVVRFDQTQEHVTAELHPAIGRSVGLGSRAHHVVLLELARARLEDEANGIADAERGWIHRDDLSRRLNLDVNHVNILIYRLRRQLAELEVADGANIVERRARSGLLRLGPRTVDLGGIE